MKLSCGLSAWRIVTSVSPETPRFVSTRLDSAIGCVLPVASTSPVSSRCASQRGRSPERSGRSFMLGHGTRCVMMRTKGGIASALFATTVTCGAPCSLRPGPR